MRRFCFLSFVVALFSLFSCQPNFKIDLAVGDFGILDTLVVPPEPELGDFTQITSGEQQSPTQIVIRWDSVDNAETYTISRSLFSDDVTELRFKVIARNLTESFYADTLDTDFFGEPTLNSIRPGYRYYYQVRANRSGSSTPSESEMVVGSLFTAVDGVTVSKGAIPRVPGEASFPNAAQKVRVTWNPHSAARVYHIYVSRTDTFDSQPTATVTAGTSFFDFPVSKIDQGVFFYAYVVAENSLRIKSPRSGFDYGFARVEGSPDAPTDVLASKGVLIPGSGSTTFDPREEIQVEWTSNGGISYSLFRYTSLNPAPELVKKGITDTFYVDDSPGLQRGRIYFYQVQAFGIVDGETVFGPFSEIPATGIDPQGNLLSAPNTRDPRIFLPTLEGDILSVFYLQIRGATKYNLYTSATEKGTYTKSKTWNIVTGQESATKDFDTGGTSYFYKLTAENKDAQETPVDDSSPFLPAIDPPTGVSASRNKRVGSINGNKVYPVEITWDQPKTGTTKIQIYRYDFSTADETLAVELPGSTRKYLDNVASAEAASWYRYTVFAVNALGQGGRASPPAEGYGAISDELWAREYSKAAEYSRNKLGLWQAGGLNALGDEVKKGDGRGTIVYKATGGLSGAEVDISWRGGYYDKYDKKADAPYFGLENTFRTNITNITNEDGNMTGTVTATGMFPGKTSYNGIGVKSALPASGQLTITQDGHSSAKFSYTFLLF